LQDSKRMRGKASKEGACLDPPCEEDVNSASPTARTRMIFNKSLESRREKGLKERTK
jgi:hypothetical protein